MGNLANVKQRAIELKKYHLYVGINPDDKHLTMVALVQEYGKHIEHKYYPYLVIPATKEFRHTYEVHAPLYKRGRTLGITELGYTNNYRVLFYLKKSVTIPSRPFLRSTNDRKLKEWTILMQSEAKRYLIGAISLDDMLRNVGEHVKKDIQYTMDRMMHPANAPLTKERKGENNPLIDTGRLRDSIKIFISKDDK